MDLTWIEISKSALTNNIQQFRKIVGPEVLLCACIKANAYGHGLLECAQAFIAAGADWLAVNSLYEAKALRDAKIEAPIYILGYVALEDLAEAVELKCRMVAYNREMIEKLGTINKPVKIHIKIETGNNRQGILLEDLIEFVEYILTYKNIEIEGLTSHFSNIEDTTDHSYAELQLARFYEAVKKLESIGVNIPIKHCANSAAAILFPKTHFQMVRIGIASYGLWPMSYIGSASSRLHTFSLIPALTWKTRVAQIKIISADEFIGYGCTYKTIHETKLAILPIGYYDGYDRGVKDGYVLIHGKAAPIRGRICMNMLMVEVTNIPEAQLEDEAILIGKSSISGSEEITAEQFAAWAGTINYEVTTRINERIPRFLV